MKQIVFSVLSLDFLQFNEIVMQTPVECVGGQIDRITRKCWLNFFFKSKSAKLISDDALFVMLSCSSIKIREIIFRRSDVSKLSRVLSRFKIQDFIHMCCNISSINLRFIKDSYLFGWNIFCRFKQNIRFQKFFAFVSLPVFWKVNHAVKYLRGISHDIDHVYIHDNSCRFVGRLNLSNIFRLRPDIKLGLVYQHFETTVLSDLGNLNRDFLLELNDSSIPVLDYKGRLLFVLNVEEIVERAIEDAVLISDRYIEIDEEIISLTGMPKEFVDIATSSFYRFLSLIVNFFVGTVLILINDRWSIDKNVAALYPIITGICGSFGTQLILHYATKKDKNSLRYLIRELAVGCVVATTFSVLISTEIYLLTNCSCVVPLVLCATMFINIIWATIASFMLPYIINTLKLDPSIASAPMLSASIDICGFFISCVFSNLFIHT